MKIKVLASKMIQKSCLVLYGMAYNTKGYLGLSRAKILRFGDALKKPIFSIGTKCLIEAKKNRAIKLGFLFHHIF